jgi:WD40 repeat protein/mono/diheme cytochrome c family protein
MIVVRVPHLGLSLSATVLIALGSASAAEPAKDPTGPVSYYRDVRPIFQQHCQGCHQPAKAMGSFVMTSHADLLKKGNTDEPGVVSGKPEASLVVSQITPQEGKPPAMPKGKDPLAERDVALIKRWIAEGAKDDTPPSTREVVDMDHPPTYALPPVITALTYSPDGSLLAVSGYHEVLLHKADGSGLVARLVGLSERIEAIAFSPDGKFLAVSGGDPGRFGEIQVWDVKGKRLKLSVPVTFDTLYGVSWSPDGTKLAFGCADNTLRAIDAETGKQVLYQGAHSDWVLDTVFSVDGSHLVSVSRDMSMKLTDVTTQRFIDNVTSITPGALKGGLMAVARHPTRNELLIGGSDGVPKIYQMYRTRKRVIGDDFNQIKSYEAMPGRVFAAEYSHDGSRVVVGSSFEGKGEVRVYESASKPNEWQVLAASLGTLSHVGLPGLTFVPDFRYRGALVAKLDGQRGPVYALTYRPDGKQVASGGFDGSVRLNDPETGKLIKEFVPVPVKPAGVASR